MVMSGRRLARRELVPHNRAENPHLAHHLAGDRHLRDVWLLAGADHAVVAGAVALVAFDRLGLDGRRHLVALAFPLRSYGYPKEEAWRVAISACLDKLDELGERAPEVIFCVLDDEMLAMGKRALSGFRDIP